MLGARADAVHANRGKTDKANLERANMTEKIKRISNEWNTSSLFLFLFLLKCAYEKEGHAKIAILVLFFVLQVARPIRQIDKAINQLGRSGFSRPIEVKGPSIL